MSKKDFYDLLGVSKSASQDEIKKAYRKLAMKYHPDKNPGNKIAEQKFRDIAQANEILQDEQKRAAYDRYGHAAFEQNAGPNPGHSNFRGGAGAGGFSDIFDEMFGDFMGGRRSQADTSTRGADLRYNLEISLETAFKGELETIRVSTYGKCEPCDGKGGTGVKSCGTCHGHGVVRSQQGFFTVEKTCPTCHGAGQKIDNPCRGCGGTGRARREKKLAVNIPAGVEEGTRIRLTSEGEAGVRGGPSGDLYIFISIKAHNLFQRDGSNIHCQVPITMVTAALGGSVEVPTIDGTRAKVSIPEGTQTGHQFRLRGKGMSILRRPGRGDMYIHVIVETPVNLSKQQKDSLEAFAELTTDKETNPNSAGFFAKVKELWKDLKD